MSKNRNRLIVVLGMHRSGTSAITRALKVLGVELGDRMMPPVEGNNNKGFWEDIDLNALNIEMLSAIDGDWCHVAAIEQADVEVLLKKGYLNRAVELLRQKTGSAPIFGFKDPRVTKLLPFWKEVFSSCQFDVSYLLAVRHPLSVVKSLFMRDGIEAELGYLLWLGHVITSLTDSSENNRVLVDYDRLMQAPGREITRIAKGVGLEITPAELQSYTSGFLDQSLRHTVYELGDLLLDNTCPPIVSEVYADLLDVASDKIKVDDLELQNKVMRWSHEFKRLKSTLQFIDRLNIQQVIATQSLAERDGRIASFNQAVHDKDIHIANLENIAASLNQVVHDKDIHIANLEHIVASLNQVVCDKDMHIANLEHIREEGDRKMASLQEMTNDLNRVVEAMLTSASWRLTRPLRVAKSAIKKSLHRIKKDVALRENFDAAWYLERNPDVAMSGIDPYQHYALFGKAEGRLPKQDSFIKRKLKWLKITYTAFLLVLQRDGEVWSTIKNIPCILRMEGMEGVKKRAISLYNQPSQGRDQCRAYQSYIESMEPTKAELEEMKESQSSFCYKPKFSIVVPVFNVEEKWLRKCIESVRSQIYPNWELCLADDCSTAQHVRPLLLSYAASDSRVKVVCREENGHISAATNSAIELATGDFMCLMDNDDEIAPNALYEFACLLQQDEQIGMIYSDEDKLDMRGNRYEPFFKPDWSPETLEGCMYTAHFACYRMSIVREVGGFRVGYDGAQDYDFVLRFTERVNKIVHVPKILYHWRAIPGSTAATMNAKDYVLDAAVRSLQDRAKRVNGGGEVKLGRYAGCFDVRYTIKGAPLVSIVIPSAGREAIVRGNTVDLLPNVVKSIHERSTYRNFEIIIVDNGDLRQETIKALSPYNCSFVHFKGRFNIATKMNVGAMEAKGEYLLFMNDDIEIIANDWMECMLQLAQRPGVGAVGAKLYFENGKIQHVGVAFWNGLPDHIRRGFSEADPGHFFSTCSNRNYLAVTGAVLMTKRSTFEKIDGFDERFAVNYNDVDYCLKVFENGERIVYASGAELYHFESISRERTVAEDEIDLFRSRWSKLVSDDPYYSSNFEGHPPNFILRNDWIAGTS